MPCGKLYLRAMARVRRKHPSWGLTRRKRYASAVAYQKKNR